MLRFLKKSLFTLEHEPTLCFATNRLQLSLIRQLQNEYLKSLLQSHTLPI